MRQKENPRRSFLLKTATLLFGGLFLKLDPIQASEDSNNSDLDKKYFPDFRRITIKTSETTIVGVVGGSGPPILLLHGFPENHLIWHKIAPLLSKSYTLVIPDLRGYGNSGKPDDGNNHNNYSKRAMAKDQVEVMKQLGYKSFKVLAHDRGARVAHRMALDYPTVVEKLVVMDIVPTYYLYTNTTKEFASVYWHWFFLIQDAPIPEKLLQNNAAFFLKQWAFNGKVPSSVPKDIFNEYLRHFSNYKTLHAMCEDYRAGATIDLEHDRNDLQTKIQCPLLVLWGTQGAMNSLYDVLAIWKERGLNVIGKALPCGHYMPEEVPQQVYEEVFSFLNS